VLGTPKAGKGVRFGKLGTPKAGKGVRSRKLGTPKAATSNGVLGTPRKEARGTSAD
jgi:hypothetical protein